MERRIIIAMGLSIIILLLWSRYVSKFYPIENKEVREISPAIPLEVPKIEEKIEEYSTEGLDFKISSNFGAIKEVYLKDYQHRFLLGNGLFLREENKDLLFESKFEEKKITFLYKDEEKEISKIINFPKEKNFIELELKTKNLLEKSLNLNLDLLFSSLDLGIRPEEAGFLEISIFKSNEILRQSPLRVKRELLYKEDIQTIGMRDRYFCLLLKPKNPVNSFVIRRSEKERVDLILPLRIQLPPKSKDSLDFLFYIGPQDKQILKSIDPRFSEIIHFGFFDSLSKFLLGFLRIFYKISRNWGLAIIFLTFFVFLLSYPLILKQLRSTRQLQALQPQIENLRRLYRDNPRRLNREIMELYRRNKVNPLGGCLPLLLQIPLLFGLYQGLMRSFELRGANFLWIKDLSQPDKAFILFGKEINLLPILMVLMMFFQQRLAPLSLTKEQRERQRMMNILFPILFGFIFYSVPSGLVLYWLTQTIFTVLLQLRFKVVFPDMSA